MTSAITLTRKQARQLMVALLAGQMTLREHKKAIPGDTYHARTRETAGAIDTLAGLMNLPTGGPHESR